MEGGGAAIDLAQVGSRGSFEQMKQQQLLTQTPEDSSKSSPRPHLEQEIGQAPAPPLLVPA